MGKKALVFALIAGLLLTSQVAWAGKKPKPYKSEEVTLAVPHPVAYSASGGVQSITAKELEATCATPSSNGLDGYAFEVPKDYQKRIAGVEAIGEKGALYDLDIYLYDTDCKQTLAFNAEGTDEFGTIPAGTGWIFIHNYVGQPGVTAHIELKAL
jgi:hypothetical protein